MTKAEAIQLDKDLDIYIGRVIYRLKNKQYGSLDNNHIDEFLIKNNFQFNKLNLYDLYDYAYVNPFPDSDRIFAMLTDLKISFVEVCKRYYDFVIQNNIIIEKAITGTAIDKIIAHQITVDFILSYRALWDKIMGIIVFVYYDNDRYQQWCQENSRKSKFKSLFENRSNIWDPIEKYFNAVGEFDNKYRTAEAHGAGSARKSTIFNTDKYLDTKYHKQILDNHFNPLIEFVNVFADILNDAKGVTTSFAKEFNKNIIQQ